MRNKVFSFLLIISVLFVTACQQPTDNLENVTNTINIVWRGSFSKAPLNPQNGWAYYDTTKKMSFVWDGTSWQVIAQDGKSIIWKGELSRAPANPEENWAYFNSIDGNSYIYNGKSWSYLAKAGRDGTSGIMLWLGTLDTAPVSPSIGYCYYNSIDKCSYIWDGDSWEILARDGSSGAGIVWKGVLSKAPKNPEMNWAYYDTTSQTSYIYDGFKWEVMAESVGGDTIIQVPVNWGGAYGTAPMNPSIGDAYYNSATKSSYIYDGTVWQQISKDGLDGKDGADSTYTYTGTGYLITWKGSLAAAPSLPSKGWAYYNSTEGKSYIWDGSSWQIMAQDGISNAGGVSDGGGVTYLYILCYTPEEQNMHYATQTFNEVDFGTVGLNSSLKTTTFYIGLQSSKKQVFKLTGTPAIQITGSDADSFSVIQPSATEADSGTYIMDAAIIFTPTSIGVKTATVTIPNNSPDYPDFSFTVKGTGAYWPKYFDGGEGDGNDSVTCAAEDSNGNLYFVGYGFELVNNHSGYDWWIKKFDKDGVEDTTNWNKKVSYYDDYGYSSLPKCDNPTHILIDSGDNVIIASSYNVVKYSSNGLLVWKKDFDSGNISNIYKDSADNILAATPSNIIKYNPSGTELFTINNSGVINFDMHNNFSLIKDTFVYLYSGTDGSLVNVTEVFVIENLTAENKWFNSVINSSEGEYWYFFVTKGAKYSIQMNNGYEGDGTKTGAVYISAFYKSTGGSIFTRDNSVYKSVNSFTALQDDIVYIKANPWSNSYGTYALKVITPSNPSGLEKIEKHKMGTPVAVCFDSDNNLYVTGSLSCMIDEYSKRDVFITKYDASLNKEWNKYFDWGHCENEQGKEIYFDSGNIIVLGTGTDLIDGASKEDSWVKIFTPEGVLKSSFALDLENAHMVKIKENKFYLYNNSSYSSPLCVVSNTGKILAKYGAETKSIVYHPKYLISNYDNSVYVAGYGSDLVSTKSGYDWQLKKY